MLKDENKNESIPYSKEIEEKLKTCIKVTVEFTHPITGDVRREEGIGSEFIGGLLEPDPEDPDNLKLAFMCMGGAQALTTVRMMSDLSEHMARIAVEQPDLREASVELMVKKLLSEPSKTGSLVADMLNDISNRRRRRPEDEIFEAFLRSSERNRAQRAEPVDGCDCIICRNKRKEKQ